MKSQSGARDGGGESNLEHRNVHGQYPFARNRKPHEWLPHESEPLHEYPTYDRTSINAWEDVEFKKAVEATGRKKLIMTALWTDACMTFPSLDALKEGYEVYAVVDAVGGTSMAAHEAALLRIEQAGGKMIGWEQMLCELQCDWARTETVPAFMDLFIETGGTACLQFSFDRAET